MLAAVEIFFFLWIYPHSSTQALTYTHTLEEVRARARKIATMRRNFFSVQHEEFQVFRGAKERWNVKRKRWASEWERETRRGKKNGKRNFPLAPLKQVEEFPSLHIAMDRSTTKTVAVRIHRECWMKEEKNSLCTLKCPFRSIRACWEMKEVKIAISNENCRFSHQTEAMEGRSCWGEMHKRVGNGENCFSRINYCWIALNAL